MKINDYELHIAAQMLIAHFGEKALPIAQKKAANADADSAVAWTKVIPLLKDARLSSGGESFNSEGH